MIFEGFTQYSGHWHPSPGCSLVYQSAGSWGSYPMLWLLTVLSLVAQLSSAAQLFSVISASLLHPTTYLMHQCYIGAYQFDAVLDESCFSSAGRLLLAPWVMGISMGVLAKGFLLAPQALLPSLLYIGTTLNFVSKLVCSLVNALTCFYLLVLNLKCFLLWELEKQMLVSLQTC